MTTARGSQRRPSRRAGVAVLIATVALLVGIDRVLLAHFGLPPWEADPVLPFRHRPYAVAASGDGNLINSFGLYDDEFPRAKPPGEFRAVALGDSVMMGHAVRIAEALPNRLEAELAARDGHFRSYQIINTGVQGYWTAQYSEVLRRSLEFAPDLVLLGFCMNDVITWYGLDPAHGGSGLDYHHIQMTPSPWLSYLVNETGFGRLAISLRQGRADRRFAQQRETYSVQRVAMHSADDPEVQAAWQRTLAELGSVYDLAAQHGLPVVVLIFPYDFQVGHPELQEPQRIVARHAAEHDVVALDATPVLERAVVAGAPLNDLFLDGIHFTPRGNALMATATAELLEVRGLVRAAESRGG